MSRESINVRGGKINIVDGSFTPISSPDYVPKIDIKWLGIDHNTEYINDYILDIMSGDYRATNFLQKLVGYSFIKQQSVTFYGNGHDGKKLFASLLDILIGDYIDELDVKIINKRPPIDNSIIVPFTRRYINKEREVFMEHNDKIKNPYIFDELLDHMEELLVWFVNGCIRFNRENINDIPQNFVNNIYNQQTKIDITDEYICDKIYHTDNERLIVPESVFKNRLSNDTGRLFQDFDWENTLLGGEYILGCLEKVALYGEFVNTPIDIYVYNSDFRVLFQKFYDVLFFLKIKLSDASFSVVEDTLYVTVKSKLLHRDINIIGLMYDNAEDLLYNMSSTCYQVGYNGESIIYTDYFVDTMTSRVNVLMTECPDILEVARITKLGFATRKSDRNVNIGKLYAFDIENDRCASAHHSKYTKVVKRYVIRERINKVRISTSSTTYNLMDLNNIILNTSDVIEGKYVMGKIDRYADNIKLYDNFYDIVEYITFFANINRDGLTLRR